MSIYLGGNLIAGSGWSMPSDRYIDLTLGASGNYTAPANGWFVLSKRSNAANQFIELGDPSNSVAGIRIRKHTPLTDGLVMCYIPIKKGNNICINYNAGGTTELFRFIYDEGEN